MKTTGWICLGMAWLFTGSIFAQNPGRVVGVAADGKHVPMVPASGSTKEKVEKGGAPVEGKAKESGAAAKLAQSKGASFGNLPHKNREKEPTRFGVISGRAGGAANAADPLDPGLASWNDRKPMNCAPGCDCRNERFTKGPVENKTRPREIPKAGGK